MIFLKIFHFLQNMVNLAFICKDVTFPSCQKNLGKALVVILTITWDSGLRENLLSSLFLPLAGAFLTLVCVRAALPVQGEDGGDGLQEGQAIQERNIASTESVPISIKD